MQLMDKDEYEARRIQVMEPSLFGTERAFRHRYDAKKRKWCQTATIVILGQDHFAEGALQKVYRMRDLSQEGLYSCMVAKMFRDEYEGRSAYFNEVEQRVLATEIAERFNCREPPIKVEFLSLFVYELVDRLKQPYYCAEYYIDAEFKKHNNSFGYLPSRPSNTLQAFSHFSFEHSNGQLMIADMQAVGDFYTDPQIHTLDGKGYGHGNLGAEGINKFFSTHVCNPVSFYD